MPRYAMAQINAIVGNLQANAQRVLKACEDADAAGADFVIFPELTLTGYPPEDLLLKPGFLEECENTLREIAPKIRGRAFVGCPLRAEDGKLRNGAALIVNGKIVSVYYKCLLPNYSVFDEERYFARGEYGQVVEFGGQKLGVVVCEDAWEDFGPAKEEAAAGARVVACLSASPFHRAKNDVRVETFARLCKQNDVYLLYCNLVGGQDELVFDGGSMVMTPQGEVIARGNEFEEDLLIVDLPDLPARDAKEEEQARPVRTVSLDLSVDEKSSLPERNTQKLSPVAEIYEALTLGICDYVRKNGFGGVIVGLSGGIDSALTAAIAVDALGSENVIGVTMPSRYSSGETKDDARILAENLGIRFETLAIEKPFAAFLDELSPLFEGVEGDSENLTEQNLQARIRAVYLMGLSNKFGKLVLNTSNKSESAVGYGTLYGDMVGGFAAIKDVFKTQVWDLSYYVNEKHGREVIPVSTIERVPSAELRPDQEDRQSIPDYPVLDPILELYVEQDMGIREIVAAGHDEETVRKVVRLVDKNEFKRRQAVIGPRVTPKAFGKDRRLPITNRFF